MLKLRCSSVIRNRFLALAAGICLGIGVPTALAQSAPTPEPQQNNQNNPDNPFPGEASQSSPQTTPTPKQTPSQQPVKPSSGSDNPFPGEDTNAPIIPVGPATTTGSDRPDYSSSSGSTSVDPNMDGDPVRSPDPQGNSVDDGFSSSRTGLKPIGDEAVTDAKPGESKKIKTRAQVLKEDVDVGAFYLSSKNWRGAQSRFEDAYGLDPENEDAVWGLAEAERHLRIFDKASAHYKLFLTYDPDGPHSRAARKALEEVEAARVSSGNSHGSSNEAPSLPK